MKLRPKKKLGQKVSFTAENSKKGGDTFRSHGSVIEVK